jgi:hypothetical protein
MNTLITVAAVHGPTVLAVDPAKVKPGWLALVIIVLMGLATYLLWRSMNRQLKKVDFDDGVDRSKHEPGHEQPAGNGAPHGAPRGTSGRGGAGPGDDPLPDGNGGASRP